MWPQCLPCMLYIQSIYTHELSFNYSGSSCQWQHQYAWLTEASSGSALMEAITIITMAPSVLYSHIASCWQICSSSEAVCTMCMEHLRLPSTHSNMCYYLASWLESHSYRLLWPLACWEKWTPTLDWIRTKIHFVDVIHVCSDRVGYMSQYLSQGYITG